MMGRRLLDAAPYDPETLSVLFEAFDSAWDEIKSEIGELPDKAEAVRLSLATVVLDLAKSGIIADADELKDIALRTLRTSRRQTPLLR
jgi:hypothetical protein